MSYNLLSELKKNNNVVLFCFVTSYKISIISKMIEQNNPEINQAANQNLELENDDSESSYSIEEFAQQRCLPLDGDGEAYEYLRNVSAEAKLIKFEPYTGEIDSKVNYKRK
ncbi:MAG: hypothetical protein MHPSP_000704, partial [Paramarteilia canceri]